MRTDFGGWNALTKELVRLVFWATGLALCGPSVSERCYTGATEFIDRAKTWSIDRNDENTESTWKIKENRNGEIGINLSKTAG